MAFHKRLDVLSTMKKTGLIPVFYNSDFETVKNIALACADGGAKAVEFTNRGDRAVDVFRQLCVFRDQQRPDLILGVGSICDAPTAAMYISAGADFVVGPLLDEETAKLCNKRKIPYSPGCGSVTEIHKAHELGVEICKVFPGAQVGGPAFVKAVTGPCPWTEIMPTGGVSPTEESLKEWFDAGIVCAGMGSKLITEELVKNRDWAAITANVRETIELINKVRGE
ncbi:Putative KHG/KDPG aldolase [Limihaloglobus sulfuriphilus]|uniref:Putative KHG/KDPG aldolase n=1 Tax=Limihaloglobus sulfuriphilus TaxID=1851148 RepID=A0A1Q2ME83_9BACT|nr:bifunctional 4-hydroxy-2-oxoglutarate aldolase/2-dehydro-3-deoxy-phosphogluconate aldolase [Limihaloglobus sulfuriphilus]AQQ70959.1 Putative KHG/KDPG aldolase [Limihaloglobus sulfuriphilus]